MRKTYLPRSWINAKLAGGASQIHGEGVFTTEPITCGEKLMEFGGEAICRAETESGLYRECSVWLVSEDTYLALPVSDQEPSLDESLNHSCDANAWLIDEVTLVARRDIAAGEEITLDQGTWNFDEAEYTWYGSPCSCGARNCRGRLTENDWNRADVRERHRGHFHPMVQRKIDLLPAADSPAAAE
jgi:hypothetical protein